MTSGDYKAALDAAIKEYESLLAERGTIDDRLAQLRQAIGTLTRLLGLTPTVPLGLTDACRLILRHGDAMTPVEIRDRLQAIGLDMSKYVNDLAAVHTILKRLHEAGELRLIPLTPGPHRYVWNRPSTPVPLTRDIVSVMHDNAHERAAMAVSRVPSDEDSKAPVPRRKRARRAQ
jgi:hypothetical protein